MKTWYITYVKGAKYEALLPMHQKFAGENYFSQFIGYTFADLEKTCEYWTHKELYDAPKGAGYWAWKPYFIWRTLEEADYGDIVFYVDAGDRITPCIMPFLMKAMDENGGRMIARHCLNYNRQWVKEDLFVMFGMTDEKFRNALHMEAGIQAWKKTDENMGFVGEWRNCCRIKKLVDGFTIAPNRTEFVDCRYDQSLYSLLILKHEFKSIAITDFYPFVKFNNLSGELP